jgi:hypothetical protein
MVGFDGGYLGENQGTGWQLCRILHIPHAVVVSIRRQVSMSRHPE